MTLNDAGGTTEVTQLVVHDRHAVEDVHTPGAGEVVVFTPAQGVLLCRSCQDVVLDHPDAAGLLGYRLAAGDDPLVVPVWRARWGAGGCWGLLDGQGLWRWAEWPDEGVRLREWEGAGVALLLTNYTGTGRV